MATTWTIAGPVIQKDNEVLKSAAIVTETSRARNNTSYHKIEVGVRNGEYTSYLGEWSQAANKLDKGVERELLPANKREKRLRRGQQIILRVTSAGSPDSPTDMAVTIKTTLDGAVTGKVRPLVSVGTEVNDEQSREAIDSVVSRVNESGMADSVSRIQVIDNPSAAASTGGSSYANSSAINYFWTSSLQTHNTTSYVDVNNTTHGDDTEVTFSDLDASATYEVNVWHTLHCLNGANSNGKIQIDVNGITTLVDAQDNGTRFLAAGASRNDIVGRALIRFTGQTSVTLNQQFALNSGSASVSFEGSSWLVEIRKVS